MAEAKKSNERIICRPFIGGQNESKHLLDSNCLKEKTAFGYIQQTSVADNLPVTMSSLR